MIISPKLLAKMEELAVTNPAMRDILEQAKVIYELAKPQLTLDEIKRESIKQDLLNLISHENFWMRQ